jgi:tRNA (guanine-N7-)-methyltransferase
MPQSADRARSVRSYVLRAGRITDAQQRALQELWPRYGVDFGAQPLDFDQLFGRAARRTVEIGFGNGEHLLECAAAEPGGDFIGIEVHRPGVGHLLLGASRAGIGNLRVLVHDAVEVLEAQISPSSLDALYLLFPDPWPKKRHHKRRIVNAPFVALAASRLRPGARIHLATDWEPYALQMLEVLDACPALMNCVPGGGFLDAGPARTATRFERRGERLGHRVRELLYQRR